MKLYVPFSTGQYRDQGELTLVRSLTLLASDSFPNISSAGSGASRFKVNSAAPVSIRIWPVVKINFNFSFLFPV